MTCLPEGKLRAYLDSELAPWDHQQVEQHIGECVRCQERLSKLELSARLARERLATVSHAAEPDVRLALADLRARLSGREDAVTRKRWRRFTMGTNRARAWRMVGVSALILALLVGVFSFAPTRAFARQLLSVFRVRKFAVVQIQPGSEDQMEQIGRALEDTMLVNEPQTLVDEPVVEVSSLEEAREIAGFNVRMPEYWPARVDQPLHIEVKGGTEISFPISRDGLVMLFELAGMDASQVPDGWSESEIHFSAPAAVLIRQGDLQVFQVPDPMIQYPDGLDPRSIGEAGLRLMGLSAQEAQRISERIDWTNTLVLPIPADISEFLEVQVAGEEGVLLRPRYTSQPEPVVIDPDAEVASLALRTGEDSPVTEPYAVLLWEKDGVVYMLASRSESEKIMQIAESMF